MRVGGGQKMSVFVHAQGIKTVHEWGGGQKMAKFCPHDPLSFTKFPKCGFFSGTNSHNAWTKCNY